MELRPRKRRRTRPGRAAEEVERNKDKHGPDDKYFRRHETTSRVHAEWDNEDSKLKTYSADDQPHAKGGAHDEDIQGPQKPMHLRTTHAPKEGKYDYLTKDGEVATIARVEDKTDGMIEDVTEDDDGDRIVDVTDTMAQQTLAGLEPEPEESKAAARRAAAEAKAKEEAAKAEAERTALAKSSLVGKTLVLGVGKRIQDVKHKIWVATVHDPYSFRGPEERAAGGGASDHLALQQNGAPKGWSAPVEGQAWSMQMTSAVSWLRATPCRVWTGHPYPVCRAASESGHMCVGACAVSARRTDCGLSRGRAGPGEALDQRGLGCQVERAAAVLRLPRHAV